MDYRVRVGDTLSAIAAKFNVSLSALEAANPQIPDPNKIFPNELVKIPGPQGPSQDPTPVPPRVVTYVVRPGDTMSSIAATHNLSLAALEAANPQVPNPNLIHPGEVLNLTGGAIQLTGTPAGPSVEGAISINSVTYGFSRPGGGVSDWVKRACAIMNVPPAHWVTGYLTLCFRESSCLPNRVNDWDGNNWGPFQSDGYRLHCSRGVAQCIPDTFAANHVPGTSTAIYDPVANIAASMRYVMRRYGVSADGHDLASLVAQADSTRPGGGY